jgi:hypothetical protein
MHATTWVLSRFSPPLAGRGGLKRDVNEGVRFQVRIRLAGMETGIESTDGQRTEPSPAVGSGPRGPSRSGPRPLGTRSAPRLRKLPGGARLAARHQTPARQSQEARERFSRTFTDILSDRFGGQWSVEWEGPNRSTLAPSRDGRSLSGEK